MVLLTPGVTMRVTEWMVHSAWSMQPGPEHRRMGTEFQEAETCAPEPSGHPRSHLCWVTAPLPGIAASLGGGSWNNHLVHAWSPPVKPTPCWSPGLPTAMPSTVRKPGYPTPHGRVAVGSTTQSKVLSVAPGEGPARPRGVHRHSLTWPQGSRATVTPTE